MIPEKTGPLVNFLREDLLISPASIETALRHCEKDPGPLPIVLWQYGFVSLNQLVQIYDWLESGAV
ncbi:MAG: DUF2949 domain-containing protein [Cyanobacteria bacterium J06635_1]